MPVPASVTDRTAYLLPSGPVSARVATVSGPPSGMASRALETRLRTICSNCDGSILMRPASGSACRISSTRSPSIRRKGRSSDMSSPERSTTRKLSTCRRERASRRRVSSAARAAAARKSATSRETAAASPDSPSIRSHRPRIADRMLLKSWAIPPLKRPSASIFCAWHSRCSWRRRSVASRTTQRMRAPRVVGTGPRLTSTRISSPFLSRAGRGERAPIGRAVGAFA